MKLRIPFIAQCCAVLILLLSLFAAPTAANAQSQTQSDYPLGAGDAIKIQVFQNPDLTLETRVSEGGTITFPLIGQVRIGGLTTGGGPTNRGSDKRLRLHRKNAKGVHKAAEVNLGIL